MRRPLPTLDDTVGPYYPPPFVANDRLNLYRPYPGLSPRPGGSAVEVRIRLLDVDERPATGALLEIWQPNARGVLRTPATEADLDTDPYFEGYGRVWSAVGAFTVTTVMPGSLDNGKASRAPYLTLTIFSDGISRLVTQMFFEGDPRNARDPVLSALPPDLAERLVAKRVPGDGEPVPVYAIAIRMRGERETPFFDDDAPGDAA